MKEARQPERSLATVLFTDIVDSTARAAELGDRAWRDLLRDHHATVRRELRRHGGREVGTAGDGFLASFGEPEAAIRCACAIRDAVRRIGLEIRSGLHMGKVDVAGATLGGIGVHIGARVAARAGAGEVLVSGTVHDSLTGSGFGFADRGVHTLKGVPGEWRLFAVTGVPEAPPAGRVEGRRALSPRAALLGTLALAVILAGILLWRGLGWPGDGEGREDGAADAGAVDGSPPTGQKVQAVAPGGGPAPGRAGAEGRGPGEPVTLAVLPFHALAAPDETGFLSVGIPDAIITKLANARQVRLRPTSAILRYEGREAIDLSEAGRELGADYLLAGTLQPAGERFRASVQLVRTSDEAPLWGESYELRRSDLLALQDSIAERVAATLQIQLTAAERERLYRRYTDDAAAYELYLRGRSQLVRYKKESNLAAVEAFEAALRLDPDYALAHAGLAMASALMSFDAPEAEVEGWRARALRAAERALELDPGLGEAHEARAAVHRNTEFDWERTIAESRRALELNPNLELAHAYLSGAYYHLGLFESAEREAQTASAMNPGAVEPLRLRGTTALLAGRFAEAVRLLEQAQALSGRRSVEWYLAQARYFAGDRSGAERLLTDLAEQGGSGSAGRRAQATLAAVRAAQGRREEAERLLEGVAAGSYMDHHVAYAIGEAYAQLGDPEQAVSWLERAVKTGLPCYPWFARDPLLEPLRSDAKFAGFLAGLRTSWEAEKARYGE